MRKCVVPVLALIPGSLFQALALDPGKSLTQYSIAVWTQQQGLPQDSVRAITQTSDGYLWLGTDEGLARFDGYEFVTFTKEHSELPSNSIVPTFKTRLRAEMRLSTVFPFRRRGRGSWLWRAS